MQYIKKLSHHVISVIGHSFDVFQDVWHLLGYNQETIDSVSKYSVPYDQMKIYDIHGCPFTLLLLLVCTREH